MAWLIRCTSVPEAWPTRCVGCGAPEAEGRLKVYGERLKASIGVAHVFERLCLELPHCPRCQQRVGRLLIAGLGLLVVPWLLLVVASFEPSLGHLVGGRTLVAVAGGLNALGLLLLGLRYWLTRPVRLLVDRGGLRGIVLRHRGVADELAVRNDLTVERTLRPRGW